MKQISMRFGLVLSCLLAQAAHAEQVKIKSVTETTYVKSVTVGSDGVRKVEPGTFWTGDKLVSNADGTCQHVRQELVELKTASLGGSEVQLPELVTKTRTVSCTAGKVDGFEWNLANAQR